MSYLVIAYPQLKPADFDQIQAFRKEHDYQFDLVEPHFTLVFPVPDFSADELISEIEKRIDGFPAFDFCLRCATINKDAFQDVYHTFLVPDEGLSKLIKLHDHLYGAKLFPHRSLDIDYIPHITVGNVKDAQACLQLVEKWNKEDFEIEGQITHLDLIHVENNSVETIHRFPLSV